MWVLWVWLFFVVFWGFLLFFVIFHGGCLTGRGVVEAVSSVFVLNSGRESFLCCDLGLCGRDESELGLCASVAVVEAFFR